MGSLSFTLLSSSGRYCDGGVGRASGLGLRKPCIWPLTLPDPGRGSEDLQLHLHRHLCIGVSFQTCGLRLPPVLPGQVMQRKRSGRVESK